MVYRINTCFDVVKYALCLCSPTVFIYPTSHVFLFSSYFFFRFINPDLHVYHGHFSIQFFYTHFFNVIKFRIFHDRRFQFRFSLLIFIYNKQVADEFFFLTMWRVRFAFWITWIWSIISEKRKTFMEQKIKMAITVCIEDLIDLSLFEMVCLVVNKISDNSKNTTTKLMPWDLHR